MLGFVVCLLLYAVLSLQDVCACTVHVARVYNICGTWDRPTNKVRTVNRVRVNGWQNDYKRISLIAKMHCNQVVTSLCIA